MPTHGRLEIYDARGGDWWTAFPGLPAHLEWPGLEFWEGALWLIGGFELLPGDAVFHDAVWRLDPGDLGKAR